jgi:hypothetical protein
MLGLGQPNGPTRTVQEMFGDLSRASGRPGWAGNASPFQGMMLRGFGRLLSGGGTVESRLPADGSCDGHGDYLCDSDDARPRRRQRRSPFGRPLARYGEVGNDRAYAGAFGGDWDSGAALGGDGDYGIDLGGGGLTVEDKITLMLINIMKKMDREIEQQANQINALQQQQKQGGGEGGGGGAPSIDVETMKLKRLIDKRSQMFDMLRQIIDKYNQTAKGIIDSMGR